MGIFTDTYQQKNPQAQQTGGVFQQASQNQLGTLPKPTGLFGQNGSLIGGVAGQYLGNVGNAVKGNIQEAANSQTASSEGKMNPFQAGANIAKNTTEAVLQPLSQAFKPVMDRTITPLVNKAADKISDSPMVQKIAQKINPNIQNTLGDIVQTGVNVGTLGTLKGGIEEGTSKVSDTASNLKTKVTDSIAEKTASADNAKIQESISPKPTAKQAKLAQSEGRLVPATEPTMFKAGTEGKILPSQKTISATETIQKNIPGAAKMNPTELYTALDKKITETATNLRPQMEQTPIKPETVQKINDDWATLKKQQMEDAPATEEPNVSKRQAKFESLLKKSGSETHADLWDTAIKYDKSIPDTVKKANSLSSESLQLQKQEWLDNRQILSDAIEKNSKPEFKQMSDMHEAQNGLNSKAKVEGAKMSKINQFLKDNPKVSVALGGASVYEVMKHLGIPLP